LNVIERVDAGATFYKDHFYGKGEETFFRVKVYFLPGGRARKEEI